MSATHDYGSVDESIFPVSKPLMKFTAKNLTTGEVKFANDLPAMQGQLYAAVVLSTEGNANIANIDTSKALEMPGVVTFIQASDIPGQNNWKPASMYGPFKMELLSSGSVEYAGQPIGVIVAERENLALEAVKAVQVTYKDIKPVIVDVLDAIQQKSFFDILATHTQGNAAAALESAPHRVTGNTRTREQCHFHLENQTAICTPSGVGGMNVFATTQWIDATLGTVAQVLGIPEASVTVEIQALGGGFGSKLLYNLPVAGMAAVAAQTVMKPVKLHMDLHTNMQFQGTRQGYYYEYEIGFDNNGKLLAIVATGYCDCGFSFQPECEEHMFNYIDSAYFCPNWSWTVQPCKTNKPVITYMRSPGSATAIFAMESMIDHIASYLKKDHLEVRKINLFHNGDTTLNGMVVEHCLAQDVVKQLETDINYADRKKQVEDFNKANRWRKRGLHVMPCRYAMMYTTLKHNTSVIIYHGDASVVIAHGGIDMGQGINTKAIQTCAYKLGIPTDKIHVVKSSSIMNANSDFTGGSTTSELICNGIIKCCDVLNERMKKSRQSLTNPTWAEVVAKSYTDGVNLTSQYWPEKLLDGYSCYTACCAEVELDILTGQYQILQVDYVYDCGTSLNPELDLGQLEGAFVMGCGLFLLESMTYDPVTGKALTSGANTYKTPLTKDLPIKLNVKFLRNIPNPVGVLSSKAVGETPVSIGACPLFALKRAVETARAEMEVEGWFPFHAPATVEKIEQACLNDFSRYTLQNEFTKNSTICSSS
uniref:Aldehyde oxidase/xanthine dehydrogenase a/b hammerhead domain-containing protein n=1 Tax=Arion vulgaris TaxID=1028688 RepID=A0A0B7AD29_9EUPU